MTRLLCFTLFSAVAIASISTASAARAQESSIATPGAVKFDPAAVASDSIPVAEVQKAAAQLAIAVQEAVRKATDDPAVKVAALRVAKTAVTAAQVVVTQQAETLQAVLDALAKEIAEATRKQQAKTKSH